jgi:Ras-related protein Rab-18
MDDDILATFKIIIIGETHVGKSSLMLRLTDDKFETDQTLTIGVDFKTKIMNIDGVNIKLAIWDTAGQERFRTLISAYYRDALGAILVYDVTNKKTFENLETWLKELELHGTKSNIAKIIVGNKTDMPNREVSREDGIRFAKKHRTLFLETSAKTNENVRTAFEEVVKQIMETESLFDNRSSNGTVDIDDHRGHESSCNYC